VSRYSLTNPDGSRLSLEEELARREACIRALRRSERIELPLAGRMEVASDGRVRSKEEIFRGVGMVTPRRQIELHLHGGGREIINPGSQHFDPSHEAVQQRPDLFRPCDPSDRRPWTRCARLSGHTAHGGFREYLGPREGLLRPVARRTALPEARGRGATRRNPGGRVDIAAASPAGDRPSQGFLPPMF
jgi:hypothetical protein